MIIGLTIYSEHVMQVEHVLTIASVLTVVGVGARYVLYYHFTLFHVKFVTFLAQCHHHSFETEEKSKNFSKQVEIFKRLPCIRYVRDFIH